MDISVLGPLELRGPAGERVVLAGARLRALLLLLALDAGRTVSAERLIDGVWGDEPPAAAGNALQALVSRLRRAGLTVEAAPGGYRLAIDPEQVDAIRFARLVAVNPVEALDLWRGDLDFPETAQSDAVRLNHLRLAALKQKIAADTSDHTAELEALLAANPLDETLAALLMRAHKANGNPGKALSLYAAVRERLADELGADPSPELAALHLELLQVAPAPKGNLPAEVSSFIGRESDVHNVRELLEAHRLVTLIGPGGSGKTRLSVEVGSKLDKEVWRVELAPVTDPAEIPQAIVTALQLRGQVQIFRPGPSDTAAPIQRLREALAGRELLLILDNCEHLITGAAEVADTLLRAAPGLRLLATSREPLGIAGERLFPVEPLPSPPLGSGAAIAAAFPSVRLLLERAPSLELTEATVDPVIRVCQALDGMPLAIELAAARLRTVPVSILADRLADRFRLLTGGSRTALPRHQTLRAVVDWSWDLLSELERRLWRRFAVFHGGADVAEAEQVCDADLDLLGALVDKSLLVLGPDGRYRMLETIREYGLERLAEAGETESQRLALSRYLLDFAATAEPELRAVDQLVWLHRMVVEHDNLHYAIRSAIDVGDRATAAAFVARIGWYWWLRGHRLEAAGFAQEIATMDGEVDQSDLALTHTFAAINGLEGALPVDVVEGHFFRGQEIARQLSGGHPALRLLPPLASIFESEDHTTSFDLVLPLFDDPDPWLRAVAKMIVGHLRINFGQAPGVAEAEMRESLAGFRAIGERWGIGYALSALADMAGARGDFATAVEAQREARALVDEVGIRDDLPQLDARLARLLWMSGDRDEAHRQLKQARESARATGVPDVIASVEHSHGIIARWEGDLAEAQAVLDRTQPVVDAPAAVPQFKAWTKTSAGFIAAALGDFPSARAQHADAVRLAVQSRDAPVIALSLIGVADLALREGDPPRAAFLLGAADSVRGSQDRTVADTDRVAAEARAALGDAGYEAAYRRGDGVTAETALKASGLASDPESDPAPEGDHRQRREDDQEDRAPQQ